MNFTRNDIVREIREYIVATIVSYLVTLILDRAYLLDKREIVKSNEIVNIHRPGSGGELFLYYLFIALLFALLIVLMNYLSSRLDKLGQKLMVWISGIIIIFLLISFPTTYIPISKVSSVEEMSGDSMNTSWNHYLFVRPIGSSQCWLQAPIPLQLDQAGGWRTRAFFAGISGEKFEVIVVASNSLLEFTTVGSYECESIALNLPKFTRLVELR